MLFEPLRPDETPEQKDFADLKAPREESFRAPFGSGKFQERLPKEAAEAVAGWCRAAASLDPSQQGQSLAALDTALQHGLHLAEQALAADPKNHRAIHCIAVRLLREIQSFNPDLAAALSAYTASQILKQRSQYPKAAVALLPPLLLNGRMYQDLASVLCGAWELPEALPPELRAGMFAAACRLLGSGSQQRHAQTVSAIAQKLVDTAPGAPSLERLRMVEGAAQIWGEVVRRRESMGAQSHGLLARAAAGCEAILGTVDDSRNWNSFPPPALEFLRLTALTDDSEVREDFRRAALKSNTEELDSRLEHCRNMPPKSERSQSMERSRYESAETLRPVVAAVLDSIPRSFYQHRWREDVKAMCAERLTDRFFTLGLPRDTVGSRSLALASPPPVPSLHELKQEMEILLRPAYIALQHTVLSDGKPTLPLTPNQHWAFLRFLSTVPAESEIWSSVKAVWSQNPKLFASLLLANEYGDRRAFDPLELMSLTAGSTHENQDLADIAQCYSIAIYEVGRLYQALMNHCCNEPSAILGRQTCERFCAELTEGLARKITDLFLNTLWCHHEFAAIENAELRADRPGICDRVMTKETAGENNVCSLPGHFLFSAPLALLNIGNLLAALSSPEERQFLREAHGEPGEFGYRFSLRNGADVKARAGMTSRQDALLPLTNAELKLFFRPREQEGIKPMQARANFELLLPNSDYAGRCFSQPHQKPKKKGVIVKVFRFAVDLETLYLKPELGGKRRASLDFGRNAVHSENLEREGELVGNLLCLTRPHGNHDPEVFSAAFSEPDNFAAAVSWLHGFFSPGGR